MQFNQFDQRTLHAMAPVTETASGKRVHLLQPDVASIDVYDIAHHLARINRFNGATHGQHGINVACHSFWVADYLYHQTRDALLAMHGLLHDAHEAYLGDITGPVKAIPAVGQALRPIEQALQQAILDALKIPAMTRSQASQVKAADSLSLAIEARLAMASGGTHWTTAALEVDHLLASFMVMPAAVAQAHFSSAFVFLNSKINRH